ncbi:TPA: leucine--tRNA ligase [candidate division CPR2 bacterium]|uniref:Leucine--tRNA ligase n=1 Tax=candidate division CPR2 bacterium GW2011_GWC1_41_48 TaxID=1618344 RepID=A0A0G0W7N6_UNCC2|nr:MAG: Leucine-tRNA ligase [candidate division CPR2 bacterium GW2011_GWC2_39_35]KKR29369.1 MAG: Leucine-tRNA ligase [candidate division CPR2 bacterium GW2011_GWD2_39_7]KKS09024.1 MAG: Leucine-tRNA ligase [candidate division CPR2 bacterium GW2011_GWC1_41_48]OGB71191.1 MAG: leucine--tRNA ligase [candidate division CPR2 bacterium GWD2_39_7]HBG81902.1 leucine--tRNA ligase [candidate division CPR2 bacterium]
MKTYDPSKIESKWQEIWAEANLYKTDEKSIKPKFYCLDMFPYPSGAGLHVGHPKGYIATDVSSRLKTLKGYRILHPMGWDAFGLPAENYAIKNKVHPRIAVEENIKRFKSQLKIIGFNYDWDREINTTDPEYYKWTQWIFLELFKKGLAYQSYEPVNWCRGCKTVLSNEDLEAGKCERCGGEVEQRPMKQWVLKITDYADRLLYDLDREDLDWEEQIKEQQRNWIGRSEGTEINFKGNVQKYIEGKVTTADFDIPVFTTRPDTIFGVTYIVLAPEHPLVDELTVPEFQASVKEYREKVKKESMLERTFEGREKTGVPLGLAAVNPINGKEVPIWIADYVLMDYGAGAVMAVPAHDQRDYDFAKKFGLDIVEVIQPEFENERIQATYQAYTGKGTLINSGEFCGITSREAEVYITDWLVENNKGIRTVSYKMKDWVFSRQRYWGEPIPIIHCEKCGAVPIPENELPLKLPEVSGYEPTGTGQSPLANIKEWVNTTCPKCGGKGKRETDTMPQWAGSSWYYLRFIDPDNNKELVDPKKEKEWMPVDLYVGGAEHATRHLLYARFWHKFLYDIGVVSTIEPFERLIHVGLILAEDGRKMSKRWDNVVNPDDIVKEYGADSLRMYEMFMGPFSQSVAWSTNGVSGVNRFLTRLWSWSQSVIKAKEGQSTNSELVLKKTHQTLAKIDGYYESFKFNLAVASLMELLNFLETEAKKQEVIRDDAYTEALRIFLLIISPLAPHIAEELWRDFGNKESIFTEKWPEVDSKLIKEEVYTLVIQVNGKLRDEVTVPIAIAEDEALRQALDLEKVKKWIEGKQIVKHIFVSGKLINIVVK